MEAKDLSKLKEDSSIRYRENTATAERICQIIFFTMCERNLFWYIRRNKRNIQQCSHTVTLPKRLATKDRTISLISHIIKRIMRILMNREQGIIRQDTVQELCRLSKSLEKEMQYS